MKVHKVGLGFKNLLDRKIVKEFFKELSFECLEVENDKSLKENSFSLLIFDEFYAKKFLNTIKELKKIQTIFTPILVAVSHQENIEYYLKEGFDDVLRYPLTKEEFKIRIKNFIKLREVSERNFESLIERSNIGFYRTTPDGRILYANPALVKMLGYESFEELSKRNLEKEGFEPEYPRKLFKEKVEKEGRIIGFESAWKRKDGKTIYVRENAWVIKDEDGNVICYEGTVEDITKEKLLQKEIERKERYYNALIQNSPDAIGVLDKEGTIVYASPSYEKIFGYKVKELIGKNTFDFFHPEEVEKLKEMWNIILREAGITLKVEHRFRKKDGNYIYVEVIACNLSKDPVVKGIIVNLRNISDKKEFENRLKESERKFRGIFESANDAIFIMREDKFIDCNLKTLQMFGCKREDIVGETPYEKFSPPFQPDGKSSKEKALEKIRLAYQGIPQIFEWRHKKLNGEEFDTEVSLYRITLFNENYLIAIVRDITDRKILQRKLEESERKYKFLYERSPTISLIIGIDMKIRDINEYACEVLGYRKEEIIGKNPLDFVYEEDKEMVVKQLERDFRGEHTPRITVRVYDKKGNIKFFYFSERQALIYKEGKIDSILVTAIDMTEKIKSEEKVKEYIKKLEYMENIHEAIIQGKNMDEVSNIAFGRINEIIPCDTVGVLGFDKESKMLRVIFSKNFTGKEKFKKGDKVPFNVIDRIREKLFSGNSVIIKDISELPENKEVKILKKEGIKSLMIVPIKHGGSIMGIISFGSKKTDNFKEEHLNFIREILEDIEIAYNQNILRENLKKSIKRLKSMYELLKLITSAGSLKDISKIFFSNLREFIDFNYGVVSILDNEKKEFTVIKIFPEIPMIENFEGKSFPFIYESIAKYFYEEEMFDEDLTTLSEHPVHFYIRKFNIKKSISLPFYKRDNFIGVVTLLWTKEKEVLDEEKQIIRELVDTLNVGFNQFYLYQEIEKNLTRITILNEIKDGLLKGRTLEEIADNVCENVRRFLKADRVSLVMFFLDKNKLKILSSKGNVQEPLSKGQEYPMDYFHGIEELKKNEISVVEDLEKVKKRSRMGDILLKKGIKSFALFPIFYENELIGSLNIGFRGKRKFSDDEIKITQQISHFVGIALKQTILREELRRYTQELEKIVEERTKKLTESEKRYRTLVESPLIAFWEADAEGNFLFVNKRFLEMTGYDSENEIIGKKNMADFVVSEQREWHKRRMELRRKGKLHVDVVEVELFKKDGSTFHVLASPAPIYDDKGNLIKIVGAMIDISERKKLEDRLIEINKELESFAYTVSHDLRAPLRAMQGFAKALLEDYADELGEEGKMYAERIMKASENMDELIQDLLEYSRVTRAEITLKLVDPLKSIEEAIKALNEDIKRKDAKIYIRRPIPYVYGDYNLLFHIFLNLISNAIKFVPENKKPYVKIWAEKEDEYVKIFVKDNGIGIPDKFKTKIFNIFERLHGVEKYSGTGIGLAIVKKAVLKLNGEIGVESKEGKGSTFWIKIKGE